jgi:hypothetical protein
MPEEQKIREIPPVPPKKVYAPPQLTVHGPVNSLTRAGKNKNKCETQNGTRTI